VWSPSGLPGATTTADGRLRHVLRTGEPDIVFQPILDLTTGQVAGYEALSRFPTLPDLAVDAVFALAREMGHGYRLEMLAVLKALRAGAGRPAGTVLSVNLSPSSLCHPALLETLPRDLHGLQVEITEHEEIERIDVFAA
jgi:EAL domain-containing protein (putative c-di-GMP-specific phosphodiesterase class I)